MYIDYGARFLQRMTDIQFANLIAWHFGIDKNIARDLVVLCKEYLLELHNIQSPPPEWDPKEE